jgi:putative transposase
LKQPISIVIGRDKTPSAYIGFGLYFYFSCLSLRRASQTPSSYFIKQDHVFIWNWIQKYKPRKIMSKKKKVEEFVVDEALIKIGFEMVWL